MDFTVIIPVHRPTNDFEEICARVKNVASSTELLLVVDKEIKQNFPIDEFGDAILIKANRGRGYNFAEGVRQAQGNVIVFLHADTHLPERWDEAIQTALIDSSIIGGGFSLRFDRNDAYLNLIIKVVEIYTRLVKSYSGDRALFIRRSKIKDRLGVLEVPIFEDAELSRFMKQQGRTVILRPAVVTSAEAFVHHGYLKNTLRIVLCSLWYAVGRDLQKIFDFYYSKE